MADRADALRRVRGLFLDAEYTVAGVRGLLGPVAGGALARDETVPALRLTADGSPLSRLLRLFWLQVPVADTGADGALVEAGLAEAVDGELRPLAQVEPVESVTGDGHVGWVVSDPKVRPGSAAPARLDHVVGQGGAASGLARLVIHRPVDNVLDLGTGSGVQALHVADPAIGRAPSRITATDVSARALDRARTSFALSGLENAELLERSLFEPVSERRFDLVVSNPPFVVAPPGPARRTYRESGMEGDGFCRRLVVSARGHLTDEGHCHLLANWIHAGGVPWEERVGGWALESGCDAWIVQRDVQDPAEYAELWLRDSVESGTGEHRSRYDAWMTEFERLEAVGVGFGWITLRRTSGTPQVRVEELRQPVQEPVGAYVDNVLDALHNAAEFSTGWGRPAAADLVQEQIGRPGAADPERVVLRQNGGLRRAAGVDTVIAALAGVCDGTLPLDPLLDAIAQLLERDPAQVREHAAAVLPELIADGFFTVLPET